MISEWVRRIVREELAEQHKAAAEEELRRAAEREAETDPREARVVALRAEGKSFQKIGDKFGISRNQAYALYIRATRKKKQ